MPALVPWLVFIHVLSAIIAFGPSFAFGLYGSRAAAEPQHGNFMARANHYVLDRMVIPVALSMPVSGLLIVWASGIDLLKAHWLLLAIGVYIVAILYATLVQRQAVIRMVELTSAPPPAGAPPGPPPGLPETAAKIRQGGMLLGTLIVIIVALMVVKPAF
jgi:uncharacterized membrane protein